MLSKAGMARLARRLARRPGVAAYTALALVAALFLAFALVTLRELDYRSANQAETFQSGTWFIHQAVSRLALLEFAVADYALSGGETERAAVREQFELFWSTVPVLASEKAVAVFRYARPPGELAASLLADLERLEPMVGGLAPSDAALVSEIRRTLAAMLGRLLDFAMATHQGRLRHLEEQGELDGRIFWRIAASIAGMLAALSGVAVLLVRETGRTRRLLREAGAARAEATDLNRRLQAVIDAVPAMITASDPSARYLIMNRFHADFYGIDGDAAVGRTPGQLGLDPAYEDEVRRVATGGEPLPFFEQTALDRHGREHVLLTTKVPVVLPGGRVGSVVHVSLDITERRAAEERVRHMAHHDPLTDLPNRAFFLERLHGALGAAARHGPRVAVHCVDLDRFKEVNDTLGHGVGDALLVAVAGRMRACLREHDTLARFGGDEFAIIQEPVAGAEEAGGVAERVVDTLSQPFLLAGNEVVISASVGVALAPDDGTAADDLLRHADMALYRAKHDGRARVRFFTAEMNATLLERRALEQDLRRTLAAGGLSLHYQPKYGLRDRRLIGLEALVRWRHPEHGFVPPGRFVPLAEETGLIAAMGEWVLLAACRQARRWIDAGIPTPPVAVNLSPAQFSHQNVVELVERSLRETGLPPDRLELEITESLLIRNSEQALAVIHQLRGLGVQVSLDDFGTGYSALSYLQRFPFDILKIDRSFTAELGRDEASLPIVEAIVRLAHGLRMRVVAEGLETPEQVAMLRGIGCDAGQGYAFAPPLAAAAVEPLLRAASAALPAEVAEAAA